MTRIERILLGLMVKRAVNSRRTKMFMKGYVTYISAVLMIVTGALQIAGLAPDVIQTTVQGWDLIMAGLAIFGVGRKLAGIENR